MSVTTISHIPVIDLTDSFSPDIETRRKVAAEIRKAARDTGFFYVSGHGVPDEIIEKTFAVGKTFFDKPLDEKMKVLGPGGGFGYDPAQGQVLDAGTPPDLKEGFMRGVPTHPLAPKVTYPEDMPEMEEITREYLDQMIALGRRIFHCIALSLDLPEDYFDDGLDLPIAQTRLLKYTPKPADAPDNQLGAGAHTDWGALTFLYQDDVGGLEIKDPEGNWIPATPVPGTFVVNLGDLIRRWTNDQYRSTLHRVVNRKDQERDRYSIATFFDARYDYPVSCVPTCLPESGEPLYNPCTVGEHILMKMEESYSVAS